eukprot:TRINITY_DN91773_c0_g1_i1.p1 TRINITY_DN91773_c0_g1~~TRINITY_DN91773_c0_g1_i1.p1  ORF type:complete len:514 (-),score=59.80 TRINITY_DN91773_c0_g1_i1:15-1454(-)
MELVEALKSEPWYAGQVVHVAQTPPRAARYGVPIADLDERLRRALAELLSVQELKFYSHQAEAVDAAIVDKRDVVISTSTGSGKSLVYLVAVFQVLLHDVGATAFMIFPTKALAQDQLRTLRSLTQSLIKEGVAAQSLSVACLDGDTPASERNRVRREARIVLTNPDMLHSHVLPRHLEYSRWIQGARYIILDEVHVYRGAFGAHVCGVLRRLRRLVESPTAQQAFQFLACSATIANPGQHLQRLLGPRRQMPVVVSCDGAPSGGHLYVLWNPATMAQATKAVNTEEKGDTTSEAKRRRKDCSNLVQAPKSAHDNQELSNLALSPDNTEDPIDASDDLAPSRRSPIVEVARLLAWLVSQDVSVLAFCKWRSLVEIILQDVRQGLLASNAADLSDRVVSYRAGYPADIRRKLERDIFSRQVLGVTCTNALELGIDIGRLDCTISLGFPGSISSLRQQSGRAGRAGHAGISFFVAFDDPTD